MRVAFVTVGDTRRLTGGYLYHARVFEELRERGIRVTEIVPCGASVADQTSAGPGFEFDPTVFDVVVVDALARVLVSPRLDRWRRERPVVAMVHELPSVAGDGDPVLEEPLLRAGRIVTVSEHGKMFLQERGAPEERISVVPPGFDRLERIGRSPAGEPRNAGEGPTRVLCVAQWIPRKDILTLVEAWSARERAGATLELVDETDADPAYATVVWHTVEAAPKDSITVTGPVDDAALARAYAVSDLFVLPSRYEGYGVVYAEALAYGLPVIACEVGPVPDLLGDEAAFLLPPGDVTALDRALTLLLEDPSRRARMSVPARRDDTVEGFHAALLTAIGERAGIA